MDDIEKKKLKDAETFGRNGVAVQYMMNASMRAKKKDIVVLSPGGFSDNSKHMFAYLSKNLRNYSDDINLTWLAHKGSEAEMLRSFGVNAEVITGNGAIIKNLLEAKICLRSTHHFARADYCMMQAAVSGATNIQMWHGIPAKKIAYQLLSNRKSAWESAYFAADCLASDYVVSESEYVAPRYQEAFPNASILINGSARTDCLIGDAPNNPLIYLGTNLLVLEAMADFRRKGGRVVLYCPTFREGGQDRSLFLNGIRKMLTEASKDADMMIVIKNHRVSKDEDAIREIVDEIGCKRILMPSSVDDIYPYMRESSVLMTDYSSSYYDFLLTGQDIVFFQPDLELYTQKRAIYDEEALSGLPLAERATDGGQAYRAAKSEQSETLKANREKVSAKLFAHRDGRSAERLARKIFEDLIEA